MLRGWVGSQRPQPPAPAGDPPRGTDARTHTHTYAAGDGAGPQTASHAEFTYAEGPLALVVRLRLTKR